MKGLVMWLSPFVVAPPQGPAKLVCERLRSSTTVIIVPTKSACNSPRPQDFQDFCPIRTLPGRSLQGTIRQ